MSDDAREDTPVTIPFPRATVAPEPVDRFHTYCLVGGLPVHLVGEWWHAEDAKSSESPTHPDPKAPGLVFGIRAEFEGKPATPLTRDEYRELASVRDAGFRSPNQVGLQGR